MKIAVINISDILGGAAIAGTRIAQAIQKFYKAEIFYLVRTKVSKDPAVFCTTPSPVAGKMERWFNIFMNAVGLQYYFLPFSPWTILNKINEEKPDIIHLHNPIGGFFMLQHLQVLSKQAPIVWTMHDMWPFTANGAHTFGDDGWKYMRSARNETKTFPHIGINTGKMLIRRKKKIYAHSNVTFVAPSRWLHTLALQSPVLEGKAIHYIPHGINLDKFRPENKELQKKKFGLDKDDPVLIFSAQRVKNNDFKGGTDLDQILEMINQSTRQKIHVLLLGEDSQEAFSEFQNLVIHPLGYVKEEEKIVAALNAADIFLYPTRADNLPLVLIESIACGTPCVTFDVGGCGDMIKDNYNGYLISNFNFREAAEKITDLLKNKTLLKTFSDNARKYAEENFSEKKMADQYFQLFNSLKVNR